jgi:hypothetical protein
MDDGKGGSRRSEGGDGNLGGGWWWVVGLRQEEREVLDQRFFAGGEAVPSVGERESGGSGSAHSSAPRRQKETTRQGARFGACAPPVVFVCVKRRGEGQRRFWGEKLARRARARFSTLLCCVRKKRQGRARDAGCVFCRQGLLLLKKGERGAANRGTLWCGARVRARGGGGTNHRKPTQCCNCKGPSKKSNWDQKRAPAKALRGEAFVLGTLVG